MLARRYNRVIEVWGNTSEEDGFSGNVTVDTKLSNSWCSIKTLNANRRTELGLNDFDHAIEVRLRHRNDLDYFQNGLFFMFQGERYEFNSIDDNNLDNTEVQILAVR